MRKIAAFLIVLAAVAACVSAAPPARKFDPVARADRLTGLLSQLDKGVAEELAEMKAVAGGVISGLVAAGARDAYVVVSLADIPSPPLLVVVPLRPGAKERAIRGLLYSGRADGPTSRPDNPPGRGHAKTQVRVVRNAVVRCDWPVLQRVKAMAPHARPELAKAFAAAGDTAAQGLLLPTADNRRVIEEMMPELPKKIGGGPSTAVTRGLQWAALGVNGPPKPSLKLTIQSADAASAKALVDVLDGIYKALAASKVVRRAADAFDKILAAIQPRAAGDRVVIHIPPARLNALLDGPVLDFLRVQRDKDLQARSERHPR
jgi:hypothetical protein